MKKSLFTIALVGFVSLVMGTPSARASISILTGGDADETVAYTPLPISVYAYEAHNVAADTVLRGITFKQFNEVSPPANFTITNVSGNAEPVIANFAVAPHPDSADDDALKAIVHDQVFTNAGGGNFNGPAVLTIGGLTTGQIYQIDLFVYSNDAARAATYAIGSATPDSYSGADFFHVDDIREQVPAVGGQIVVTITGLNNNGAFLNAFSVSTPEPASMSLIGVGATTLLMRRRRHA